MLIGSRTTTGTMRKKLTLESIGRAGAGKMLQKALEGEVRDYFALFADELYS